MFYLDYAAVSLSGSTFEKQLPAKNFIAKWFIISWE